MENKNVSKSIIDFSKNHTKKETYGYNNHNFFSKFISGYQYDINHEYIGKIG